MDKLKVRSLESTISKVLVSHFNGFDVVTFDVGVKGDFLVISVHSTGAYERRLNLRKSPSVSNLPQDVIRELYAYTCRLVNNEVGGSNFSHVNVGKTLDIFYRL